MECDCIILYEFVGGYSEHLYYCSECYQYIFADGLDDNSDGGNDDLDRNINILQYHLEWNQDCGDYSGYGNQHLYPDGLDNNPDYDYNDLDGNSDSIYNHLECNKVGCHNGCEWYSHNDFYSLEQYKKYGYFSNEYLEDSCEQCLQQHVVGN